MNTQAEEQYSGAEITTPTSDSIHRAWFGIENKSRLNLPWVPCSRAPVDAKNLNTGDPPQSEMVAAPLSSKFVISSYLPSHAGTSYYYTKSTAHHGATIDVAHLALLASRKSKRALVRLCRSSCRRRGHAEKLR